MIVATIAAKTRQNIRHERRSRRQNADHRGRAAPRSAAIGRRPAVAFATLGRDPRSARVDLAQLPAQARDLDVDGALERPVAADLAGAREILARTRLAAVRRQLDEEAK